MRCVWGVQMEDYDMLEFWIVSGVFVALIATLVIALCILYNV